MATEFQAQVDRETVWSKAHAPLHLARSLLLELTAAGFAGDENAEVADHGVHVRAAAGGGPSQLLRVHHPFLRGDRSTPHTLEIALGRCDALIRRHAVRAFRAFHGSFCTTRAAFSEKVK